MMEQDEPGQPIDDVYNPEDLYRAPRRYRDERWDDEQDNDNNNWADFY